MQRWLCPCGFPGCDASGANHRGRRRFRPIRLARRLNADRRGNRVVRGLDCRCSGEAWVWWVKGDGGEAIRNVTIQLAFKLRMADDTGLSDYLII